MSKLKWYKTIATTGVIYDDNSNAIIELETVGKLSLGKAKKYFKNDFQLANAKTIEVLEVKHEVTEYTVDDTKLYEFLKSNGEQVVNEESEVESGD